ncbi:MAG: hypothetical protein ACYDEX_12105 [Mobilitalea sp.]
MDVTNMDNSSISSYTATVETYSGEADVTYYYWKDTDELVFATQKTYTEVVCYYFLDGECFYIYNRELLDTDIYPDKDYKDLYYCNTINIFTYEGQNISLAFKAK